MQHTGHRGDPPYLLSQASHAQSQKLMSILTLITLKLEWIHLLKLLITLLISHCQNNLRSNLCTNSHLEGTAPRARPLIGAILRARSLAQTSNPSWGLNNKFRDCLPIPVKTEVLDLWSSTSIN